MNRVIRAMGGFIFLAAGALTCVADAQTAQMESGVPGILPSGFGESVDKDIARVRAATERFKKPEKAIAAGYPAAMHCIDNPPQGAMGFHYQNNALLDTKLEVERPEVLVYEKMADGSFKLNGVEYLVPISEWKKDEPPTIMGQKLKRAERLGIWYLHVWVWEPSPSGIFADWNPRVKC